MVLIERVTDSIIDGKEPHEMMHPMIEYLLTFREHAEEIGSEGESEEWHRTHKKENHLSQCQCQKNNNL